MIHNSICGHYSLKVLLLSMAVLSVPLYAEDHGSRALMNKNKQFVDLMNTAEQKRKMGRMNEAIADYSGLLLTAIIDNNEIGEVECLVALGTLYWNEGYVKKSADYYAKALNVSKTRMLKNVILFCETALEIYELYQTGKVLRGKKQFELSEKAYLKAIELSRNIQSAGHEVKCVRQLSMNYYYASDLKKFYLANKIAYGISAKNNLYREKAHAAFNLGFFKLKTEKYYDAYVMLQEAIFLYRRLGAADDEAECLHNIALIYYEMGNYEYSIKCLNKIFHESLNDELKTAILISLGNAAKKLAIAESNRRGQAEAVSYYRKALDLAIKAKNRFYETVALNNLGYYYFQVDSIELALRYFKLSSETSEWIPDRNLRCTVMANMGNAYLQLKKYDLAERYYSRADRLLAGRKDPSILWEVYFGLGQCSQLMGYRDQALSWYIKSIHMIELMTDALGYATDKTNLLYDKRAVFEAAIRLLFDGRTKPSMSQGAMNTMLSIIENYKAHTFIDFLHKKKQSEYAEDSNDFDFGSFSDPLKSRVDWERSVLPDRFDENLEVGDSIDTISTVNNSHLLSSALKKLAELIRKTDTAIVMYFLGEMISLSFIFSDGKIECIGLPARDELEKYVGIYLRMLSTMPQYEFQGKVTAHKIFREIIMPGYEGLLREKKNIVIVPDGILCYLPFETLVIKDMKNNELRYLIERHGISYAPSLCAFYHLNNNERYGRRGENVLMVGKSDYSEYSFQVDNDYLSSLKKAYARQGIVFQPLKGVAQEIKSIASLAKKEKSLLLYNEAANEEFIKNHNLSQYRIIHFACHSLIDEKLPSRTALLLSRNMRAGEDGYLQVDEILDLKLNADLVVLSSCQTGRGRQSRGEAMLGLAKTFFYAGAKSVVSTLWNVNDASTAVFMNDFYSNLFRGKSKSEALRNAKLRMIKSKFSHPYYWAPFVLSGNYASSWKLI